MLFIVYFEVKKCRHVLTRGFSATPTICGWLQTLVFARDRLLLEL